MADWQNCTFKAPQINTLPHIHREFEHLKADREGDFKERNGQRNRLVCCLVRIRVIKEDYNTIIAPCNYKRQKGNLVMEGKTKNTVA